MIVKVKTVLKLFGSLEKPSKSQCRWCCTLHVPVSAVKVKRWIKNYTLSATYSTKNLTILRYYLLFCTHTCSLKQNFELLKPHPDIFFFFQIRVHKFARIVQMNPLRLRRGSLGLQKFSVTNREPLSLHKFSVTHTVLSLPFSQQIQCTFILNVVNLN